MTLPAKLKTCHSSLELQCHAGGLGVTSQSQLGWYLAHLQPLILYFCIQNALDVNTRMEQPNAAHGWLLFEITLENHPSF